MLNGEKKMKAMLMRWAQIQAREESLWTVLKLIYYSDSKL